MEISVGTKFTKKFGRHGQFNGVVVAKNEEDAEEDEPSFRVKYEDGDEEVMGEKEILKFF
jgi:hypothetical protein